MALVFMDGFDHYTAGQAALKGWSTAFDSMPAGRFGGQCAGMTHSGGLTATHALPSNYSTLIAGVAVQTGANLGNFQFQLRAGATASVKVLFSSSKIVVQNSSSTVIATGTTTILTNTWYYIEIKAVINGASGSCAVQLNGVSEIGTTTGNFGSTNLDTVAIINGVANVGIQYDDLYVCDTTGADNNTFLGDSKITTLRPGADGTYQQFTPSTGPTHWPNVDDTTPDGDTSYIKDSNPGDIDSFICSTVDPTATVFGVQTNMYARKDDTATREITQLIRQGGVDYLGATNVLSSSYAFFTQLNDKDPTGADWTAANVNSDEFGVKELL